MESNLNNVIARIAASTFVFAIIHMTARVHAQAGQFESFDTIWQDTFDTYETGGFTPGTGQWTVVQQRDTSCRIAGLDKHNRALCLLDDHVAEKDATCRARRRFDLLTGRFRLQLRMMLRKGEARAIRQDMGLHLYGPARLLDLFFSGGELKTWQGDGWASLEPPVPWAEGQWYDVTVLVDPDQGHASITVNGQPRAPVPLRNDGVGITMVELISQRFAQGELWVDDLSLSREIPPALRQRPSQAWDDATARKRRARWYADRGSRLRFGRLQLSEDRLASMRRLISIDLDDWPRLQWRRQGGPEHAPVVYLRRVDTGQAVRLPDRRSPEPRRTDVDLFAATGWTGDGPFDVEILVSARGKGTFRVDGLSVKTRPRHNRLEDPASVWTFVDPRQKPNRLEEPLTLRVDAEVTGTVPVSQGIPFPQGHVFQPDRLVLRGPDGHSLPLQTTPLSVWPDGSMRWLLLDTVLTMPQDRPCDITLEATDTPQADGEPIAKLDDDRLLLDVGPDTLRIDTARFGPMTGLAPPLSGAWDFRARFDNRTFAASTGQWNPPSIEYNGPVRATVVLSGTLSDGTDHPFDYELRLTSYRGIPRLDLSPSFLLKTEQSEIQLQEVALVFDGNIAPGPVVFGTDDAVSIERPAGSAVALLQDTLDHLAISLDDHVVASGTQAAGWLHVPGLTVAVRRFHQQFRKRLGLDDRALTVELWAGGGRTRRFGRGAAKTHDLTLIMSDENTPSRHAAGFEYPAVIYPGAPWIFHSLGLGHFPIPSAQHAAIDRIFEAAIQGRYTEQKRREDTSYGMVHYGEINHINSEIDAATVFFMQWARTGQRTYLETGLDWALHSQDIDVCLWSPDPREIGIHHSHYPSDHNNGGLTLTHTWIRGQLFRYYLTGDRRSLLAADLAGRAFAQSQTPEGRMFDGGNPGGGIGSRAYGRACWAQCELVLTTRDPAMLTSMARSNGYLVRNLRPDGAVPASHDGSGNWNRHDECPHMAAICAVGLARYAELTGDTRDIDDLRRIADWQISRGTMPEKLGIMYHNYPGGETIHFIDACADMLEAWAYLYDATGNPLYRAFAESVYDTMIEMAPRWTRDWTMGVRNVLYYLGRRDTWPPWPTPPETPPDDRATRDWLRQCQTDEGGFALAPGLPPDMDSTYRAVDALRLVGAEPRAPEACRNWILSCVNDDGGLAGEPQWHSNVAWTWFGLKTLDMLGESVPDPAKTVQWLQACVQENGGAGASPVTGRRAYHPGWTPSAEYTAYLVQALDLLHSELADPQKTVAFLKALQYKGGGFRHSGATPATAYTLDAVTGLAILEQDPTDRNGCLQWLLERQQPDAGFAWEGGTRSTLRNTAHCVMALAQLSHEMDPGRSAAVTAFVNLHANPDGGFGYAPGHPPTVTATWYALKTQEALIK